MPFFAWLESSALGRAVAESLPLTAGLSAAHLIGFTLVMGGAAVSNARLAGILLPGCSASSILRVGRPVILTGLAISVGTGFALFSARAATAAASSVFQLKMSWLLAALALQIWIWRRAARAEVETRSMVLPGSLGLVLWLGLALTACWFILFE